MDKEDLNNKGVAPSHQQVNKDQQESQKQTNPQIINTKQNQHIDGFNNEHSNGQITQISKEEIHDSIESKELLNQISSLNKSSNQQSNQKNQEGYLLHTGDEPNDIDDDLNFSTNTFETKDRDLTEEQTKTNPSMKQLSKNEHNNNLEDSLEGNSNNLVFKGTPNKLKDTPSKQYNSKDDQIIVIENQQEESQSINEKQGAPKEVIQNDLQKKNNKQDPEGKQGNLIQNQKQNEPNAKQSANNSNQDLESEEKQRVLSKNSDTSNQKLVTFQGENNLEEQDHQLLQNVNNQKNSTTLKQGGQQDLQTVNEESLSLKGSIIPPQTNVELNPKDINEEQTGKKPFDYQKLEGFLKNQKRNLVYPSTVNEQQEQLVQSIGNIHSTLIDNQQGDESPLVNKGNASRGPAGLSLKSDKIKFNVQPIVNSSQFFNQDQNKEGGVYKSNNMKGAGQTEFDEGQQKPNSQSLQASEVYQSNFYQDGGQSAKNFSEQTFISISNSSQQPSQFMNKLNSNKFGQFNSQEELNEAPNSKFNTKRFTNLRESMNDEQDIPEELSTYSKNTVQRYMVEQVNLVGSGSIKDGKRQSTASMLTVESKDMEAATQDQVRKIVAEQVENMIKSKLNGQSASKQNNMIINNEEIFRQVIREELQNFLKNNANLNNPASLNHISSPSNSHYNSRLQQDRRSINKLQNDKHSTEKKQSAASMSQKEQAEINSMKDQQGVSATPPYLNNEEIEDIIDESIQKHQMAQLQNRLGAQNEQLQQKYKHTNANQNQNIYERPTTAKQNNQYDQSTDKTNYQETTKKVDFNRNGDYPISISNNQHNSSSAHKLSGEFGGNVQNNQNMQMIANISYKDQYMLFKNALSNEVSRDYSLQNYTQNYQVHERQPSLRMNQHQTSYISSENSPQFARERDSLRLAEISFSLNKQQSNHPQNNRHLLSNESHQLNLHPHQQQSKQSIFQQQQSNQNRNVFSKQSDYSIQSFAPPPLPQSRQSKYPENHNNSSQNQQESIRDTLPDEQLPGFQSPSSLYQQQTKDQRIINYQEQIMNPPKRHNRVNSDFENETGNYNNLMESSIIQRNSEQHQSLESIQHQVFQNQSGGYNNQQHQQSQKIIQQKKHSQQEMQNQQSISQIWEKALDFHQRGQLNRAYQMLLDIEDDIYLIRMMSRTGPCFSKLSQNIGKKLLRRINKITQSQFMDNISLQLFQKVYDQDLIDDLNLEDNQSIKEILYDISASPQLGEQAARLYNLIDRVENN